MRQGHRYRVFLPRALFSACSWGVWAAHATRAWFSQACPTPSRRTSKTAQPLRSVVRPARSRPIQLSLCAQATYSTASGSWARQRWLRCPWNGVECFSSVSDRSSVASHTAPSSCCSTQFCWRPRSRGPREEARMKRLTLVLAGLSLVALLVEPAAAQQRLHKRDYQWYWGGQAGAFYYQTSSQGYYFDPIIGGHWVITAKRTALYVAYEQAVFLTDAKTIIIDPSSVGCSSGTGCRDVTFSDMRRIMFGVLAYPTRTFTEPYFGGGFAMMQVLNPTVD